ncbi:MAG: AMP-binding protein, partial [Woeseiaceae bacterium]|nr:AMP-binding protein [Woeseiaceae bacterium]
MTTLLARIAEHPANAIALVADPVTVSYGELREAVDAFAARLLAGREDLAEERVAMLLPAGPDYVTTLLAIWRAGGVAVPLAKAAAAGELEYALGTARASRLVTSGEFVEKIGPTAAALGIEIVAPGQRGSPRDLPEVAPERRAMMLFTSGTTSRPKGV